MLQTLAEGGTLYPNFRDAVQVETVIEGVLTSAATRRWVDLAGL